MMLTLTYPLMLREDGTCSEERVTTTVLQERTSAARGRAVLREHLLWSPLAPGDIVEFDALDQIRDLAHQEDLYTYEVLFKIPANLSLGRGLDDDDPAEVAMATTVAQWNSHAWATRDSGLSAIVSAQTETWLREHVAGNRYVMSAELVRWPGMPIDFDVMVMNANFDRKGPWA